jgi:hypothetical protein
MSLSLCLVWIDAAALAIDDFDFPCIFLAARTSRLTMPVHETEQVQCQSNALDIYAQLLTKSGATSSAQLNYKFCLQAELLSTRA